MNRIGYITAIVVAFFAPAVVTIIAETPAPPPASGAAAPALTRQARATLIAGQLISQVTNILNGAVQVVNSGTSDQPSMPAVDAKDIQNALGPEYVAWLRSAAAGPIALPTPTPAPKK